MGYSTGSASNVSDLLSSIRSFAIAEGWTADTSVASRSDGTAGDAFNITKGSISGAFYSQTSGASASDPGNFMGTYTYPSYSGGSGNMAQSNPSAKILTNGIGAGPFVAHHLFGYTNHIHVVVETISGTFKHFGLGMVEKHGAVTSGVYNYASRWNYAAGSVNNVASATHGIAFDALEGTGRLGQSLSVRADSDAISNRYFDPLVSGANTNRVICGWRNSSDSPLYGVGNEMPASSLTGRTIIYPFMLSVARGSGMFSPIGFAPDLRFVRLDNFNPGDVLTIASDDWMLFPLIRKNGTAGDVNSGNYGYAYLQRP